MVRVVEFDDFFVAPGDTDLRRACLRRLNECQCGGCIRDGRERPFGAKGARSRPFRHACDSLLRASTDGEEKAQYEETQDDTNHPFSIGRRRSPYRSSQNVTGGSAPFTPGPPGTATGVWLSYTTMPFTRVLAVMSTVAQKPTSMSVMTNPSLQHGTQA